MSAPISEFHRGSKAAQSGDAVPATLTMSLVPVCALGSAVTACDVGRCPKHAAIITQALHQRGRGIGVERLGEREFETAGASRAGEREGQAGEGLQACIGERRKL